MEGLVYVVIVLLTVDRSSSRDCVLPGGLTGSCIPRSQCPFLVNKDFHTIRRYHCDYRGDILLVCCPPATSTAASTTVTTTTTKTPLASTSGFVDLVLPAPSSEKQDENACVSPAGWNGTCVRLEKCLWIKEQGPAAINSHTCDVNFDGSKRVCCLPSENIVQIEEPTDNKPSYQKCKSREGWQGSCVTRDLCPWINTKGHSFIMRNNCGYTPDLTKLLVCCKEDKVLEKKQQPAVQTFIGSSKSCRLTWNGQAGVCVPPRNCPWFHKLISWKKYGAVCGGYKPGKRTIESVCCPTGEEVVTENSDTSLCLTYENKGGVCRPYGSCSHLKNLVKLSKRSLFVLRKSVCGYKENEVLMCCPIEAKSLANQQTRRQPARTSTTTTKRPTTTPINRSTNRPHRQPSIIQQPSRRPPSTKPNPLDAYKSNCGKIGKLAHRVIGGEDTLPGDWPWVAGLIYSDNEISCAGALITNKHVITAAHCVIESRVRSVVLGEWDWSKPIDCWATDCSPLPQKFTPVKIIKHPQYTRLKDNVVLNDVAIIELDRPAELTIWVSPICVDDGREKKTAQKGWVIGWGLTGDFGAGKSKILQELDVPILSFSQCAERYGDIGVKLSEKEHMCAGGEKGFDSCRGDSGGPLMVEGRNKKDKRHYLIGIVSFGVAGCGRHAVPGIYTNLESYYDWITEAVN